MSRSRWTSLPDAHLLAQCEVDTYRASGPGGQKRNKTSSAVRLRHPPSGLIVIAEESRSQHENRVRALKRLRQALFLKLREPVTAEVLKAIGDAKNAAGRLDVGRKDARYWPAVGAALDVLEAHGGRVHESAEVLGVSTANFLSLLQLEAKVWAEVNILRQRHGQKPLRAE